MKNEMKKLAAITILSGLSLAGAVLSAAEFEVLDKFSVDGYSVLRGSADIQGNSFTVGGSTFVVNNGNVGIGTISPGVKLDVAGANVVGTSQTGGNLFIRTTDSYAADKGGMLSLGGNSNQPGGTIVPFASIAGRKTNGTEEHPSGYFTISTFKADYGHLERLRIDSDGNVGIGTTGPGAPLHVATQTGNIGGIIQGSYDANANPMLQFRKSNGTIASLTAITSGHVTGQVRFEGYDGSAWQNGADIYAVTTGTIGSGRVPAELVFRTMPDTATPTLTERMRIDKSGDVGIGTAAPSAKLEIKQFSDSAPGGLRFVRTGTSNYWDQFEAGDNGLYFQYQEANPGYIAFSSGGGAYFGGNVGIGYANPGTAALAINGNVGIGTTAPGAKLAIAGSGWMNYETSGEFWPSFYLGQNSEVIPGPGDIILLIPNNSGTVNPNFVSGTLQATRGHIAPYAAGRSHAEWYIVASRAYTDQGASMMPLTEGTMAIKFVTFDYGGVNYLGIELSGSYSIMSWSLASARWLNNYNSQKPTVLPRGSITNITEYKAYQSFGDSIIVKSGNVGIGTAGPEEKLDVNGIAQAATFELNTAAASNYNVRLVTCTGDGGANSVQVYWNASFGAAAAGGCLGAYDRSGNYAACSAGITGSNTWTIYGFIGVPQ